MLELSRAGDAFAESLIGAALALAEAIAAVEEIEQTVTMPRSLQVFASR